MFVLKLKLKPSKRDLIEIEKRFRLMNKGHNILVSHALKLMNRLQKDKHYQDLLKQRRQIKANPNHTKEELKAAGKLLKDYQKGLGLSEYGLQEYIQKWRNQYAAHINSRQMQEEASRVWKGVESCLFGTGKQLHYRKLNDMFTIRGKMKTTGVIFHADTFRISWTKLDISCRKPDFKDPYIQEAFSKLGNLKYCEIKREQFSTGWHYYVYLYIDDTAPKKIVPGKETIGIDPGMSTMAFSSDTMIHMGELAPKVQNYNKAIREVQKTMDRSRRAMNPDNYNPDGTVKKGKRQWKNSNHYYVLLRKLRTLYRKKSAYTTCSHGRLANCIAQNGVDFLAEKMDYRALAKRAKETKRQDKMSTVKASDGTTKQIQKYKRKKRYGSSLNNRAPASFLAILKRKANQYEGHFQEVDTKSMKASQYDHSTDTYTKIPLSQRSKLIGGHLVLRDAYSAFLIQHANAERTKPDRESCIRDFPNFLKQQGRFVALTKQQKPEHSECFGF